MAGPDSEQATPIVAAAPDQDTWTVVASALAGVLLALLLGLLICGAGLWVRCRQQTKYRRTATRLISTHDVTSEAIDEGELPVNLAGKANGPSGTRGQNGHMEYEDEEEYTL